tara:strand:- start:176 stop:445 length:270 start_codon:yes stop_codon:yes gene_type:complete
MSNDATKIKVNPSEGQEFKPFYIEILEPTMVQREKMMNTIMQTELRDFSTLLQIIRWGTAYTDQELNEYSNDQLAGMCNAVVEKWSKKK